MDNKIEIRMYPDEETTNAAVVEYIRKNCIFETEWCHFINDPDVYDIKPCGGLKGTFEWYGEMDGVMFTDAYRDKVIFATWFNPYERLEFDEYFNKVMTAMTLMSPSDGYCDR